MLRCRDVFVLICGMRESNARWRERSGEGSAALDVRKDEPESRHADHDLGHKNDLLHPGHFLELHAPRIRGRLIELGWFSDRLGWFLHRRILADIGAIGLRAT